MFKDLWERKLVRFLCVGSVNTVIDFSILNILVDVFGMRAVSANLISASISITISYFLNHYIVFRHHERHSLKGFVHFFAITGFSVIAIQSLIIELVMFVFGIAGRDTHLAAQGIHGLPVSLQVAELNIAKACAVGAGMVWNFILYNKIVFRQKDGKQASTLDELEQLQ